MENHWATRVVLAGLVMMLVGNGAVQGQTPPRLVPFSGVLRDAQGVPLTGSVLLTFAIYADMEGGSPLWQERQAVQVDAGGHYTATLGAATPEGVPLDLFASVTARWLGVQADGAPPLPRVMLVSVPYALKAGDAETIGGRPLSSFVLAGETTGKGADGLTYVNTRLLEQGLAAAGGAPPSGGTSGTAGYIGRFTDSVNLGNSVIFQSGTSIGVGTTSPEVAFHAKATSAPGAFIDVYSNTLGALPMVYRAARGTPASPAAVQTDDILGGLAVRGHDGTAFSGGRGQVMFKAAENWTPSAQGTYLSMATVPIGGLGPAAERMRVAPNGYVGFGTSAPEFPIDVRQARNATYARFGPPSGVGAMFAIANNPMLGFNVYYEGGYRYGGPGHAGYLAFGQDLPGGLSFATGASGVSNAAATMTPRMVITNDGKVGIGTINPSQTLSVTGNIGATGNITATGSITVTGTLNAETVSAGPGLTGTPFAYASYNSSGTKIGGTANISCAWDDGVSPARWLCTLSQGGVPVDYSSSDFVAMAIASASSTARVPVTNPAGDGGINKIAVRLFDLTGASNKVAFSIVVYKL